jgi:hypothetical protein
MRVQSANTGVEYDLLTPVAEPALAGERRWVGRCKRCGRTHKLEGVMHLGRPAGRPGQREYVVVDQDDLVWTTAALGSDVSAVVGPCGDHRCTVRRVVEGSRRSKHECGARCTSATGPNCDCRCRGQNHGRDC